MNVKIVTYDDSDGVKAVYIDGDIYHSGDSYHHGIRDWIEGFISGLQFGGNKIDLEEHCLTKEEQERFAENGYDVPEKFPNEYEYVDGGVA